jgi:general secretion pathway protein L
MSLLRIRVSLAEAPPHCQWALLGAAGPPLCGSGTLAQLPRRAERVQLVLPAAQVLLSRVRLPRAARRHAGSVLAYALEDRTVGEPDAAQVSWLGAAGDTDVLAVVDRPGLQRWLDALEAAGVAAPEVQCETLMLPWTAGTWSLAWDGREGYVRSGPFEGAATDSGEAEAPPLALRLMLAEAQARGEQPAAIAVYATAPDAAPDLVAWQRELGVPLHLAGTWDWRRAAPDAGVRLAQGRRAWRIAPALRARLRPAAWIAGAALAIHAVALVTDWSLLARQQRGLRQQMVARFRASFPDAVAVVDPALQMRRQLAAARHAAGLADGGDFLPMLAQVTQAARELPPGALRVMAYESGRMSIELSAVDAAGAQKMVARLREAGLAVDPLPAARAAGAPLTLTVRAS